MTIVESRLKNGVFTLGTAPEDFACQATNVMLNPNYEDDGDEIEALCGDKIPPGKKETWTLSGTSVQDFDDPEGFVIFCRTHAMETVAFTWQPNAEAETASGSVVVLAVPWGGDVNTRLTTDWEFDVSGSLTYTPAAGTLEAPAEETVAA